MTQVIVALLVTGVGAFITAIFTWVGYMRESAPTDPRERLIYELRQEVNEARMRLEHAEARALPIQDKPSIVQDASVEEWSRREARQSV